ncbi:hypothetical protein BYT27DRAFT_7249906 [Phlegmacium glaucopus]|nr:hypothetical protein BYT27DRAFT_7249906 [Phlegmacium glaucopus]
MRNSLPLLSRSPAVATPPQAGPPIPSIRLISATPSASGLSSEASTSFNRSLEESWASVPVPLAPKPDVEPRKRLVPKKSKLSILSMGRDKEKDRGKDLSDVVRRVGGDSITARGGFEIFVDPTMDPDIGEIVMVKKKKSRAALDGMAWGALGEVTNVPKVPPKETAPLLKVKNEEKEKWWTLGRGRKDSKEKTKENKEKKLSSKPVEYIYEPPRSKTPEPFKVSQEARGRFNSLDSGVLLNGPANIPGSGRGTPTVQFSEPFCEDPSPVTYSRAGTPTAGGLLAVPSSNPGANNQGSIALRAIRSVRSLARMGSWAQLKNMPPPDENQAPTTVKEKKSTKEKPIKEKPIKEKPIKEKPTKEKGGKKKEKTKAGDAEEKGEEKKKKSIKKDKAQTVRLSSSSFEVGGLTASPEATKTLGLKKPNILGLGLPSTMRLPTVRAGSTASSNILPVSNRLSVDSATILNRNRAGSVISTGSSLRPLSTTSTESRTSSSSSTASVRWDEQGLETVREQRKKEREVKKQNEEKSDRRVSKESRRSSEGRRRTPLSSIFSQQAPSSPEQYPYPILTIEEATSDGHGAPDDDEILQEEPQQELPAATPMKRARVRPLSEQLLGRSRPRPMHEDDEGVLSILDAATNDLALLINTLDLQATPATPDMTPLRPSPLTAEKIAAAEYDGSPRKKGLLADSPLKNTLRSSMSSISSLRPYAQSRGTVKPNVSKPSVAALIAQQITPWPTLIQGLSPLKEASSSSTSDVTPPSSTFRPTHNRTLTPAPEPEPELVFQPLRPGKARTASGTLKASDSSLKSEKRAALGDKDVLVPSSLTFGSRSSSRAGSKGSEDDFSVGSLTPVFKRILDQGRKRSSLVPANYRGSRGSQSSDPSDEFSLLIARETRKVLGMSGTMGGSDVSCYQGPELDASDPDSDVPDELRFILATHSDRDSVAESLSFQDDQEDYSPRPSFAKAPAVELPTHLLDPPPMLQLPVFRASLIDDEQNQCDIDEYTNTSDEDTKKSFDFTGELKKLNESGGSDRRSFVEQLENAFRTPAKVDLRYDFGGHLCVDVPAVPNIPVDFKMATEADTSDGSQLSVYHGSQLLDVQQPSMVNTEESQESMSEFDSLSGSQLVNVPEPSLLLESDNLTNGNDTDNIAFGKKSSPNLLPSPAPSSQRPSDGQLNRSFKFGGLPRSQSSTSLPKEDNEPLTLSDIIPPPSHARSLSYSTTMDEDDSILKSIFAKITAPEARSRVTSDASARQAAREKRRSIYKSMSRPTSGISFAGFESFEEVRRGFEFSDERPAFYPPPAASRRVPHRRHESALSIMSVSSYGRVINSGSLDPFDYGLPSLRERPSSEDVTNASISVDIGDIDDTFAFMANRPRRRVESDASSFYFRAPLPQQYGHSFTRGHRHRDSNMSVSSQAPPISLYNRSFGTHRRNDSSASSSSVALSYARHGANSGMAAWTRHRKETSVDSVMSDFSGMHLGRPGLGDKMFNNAADHGPLTSITASPPESATRPHFGNRSSFDSIIDEEQRSSAEDSLFEKTNYRSSISSDSVFGDDYHLQNGLLLPNQFRPVSVASIVSIHSPMKDDDTMISMLGGGHVRRRSIGSLIEASPCVRVEKRKHSALQGIQMYKGQDNPYESPNKARIVEKPSIASTSSYQFGGDRMIKAQRGLLERQSLEDSCLSADGEELASAYCTVPVFTRPAPTTRSRSSTCTSSSGGDTPPLSSSEGSSGGSQSSIDLSQINIALSNATHPMSTVARNRARARARGTGHRRRYSKSHISRSSVYETIEEEMSNASSPAQSLLSKKSSPTTRQPVFIVDSDTASIHSKPEESTWDDERGIVTLRKYYALRDEAENVVVESKRTWLDTPFSLFALQTFQAPGSPAGMQALLEHSVQSYHPLPSELRSRRVRTSSRPSPYPQSRVSKTTISPDQTRPSNVEVQHSIATPVLQQININSNIMPSLDAIKAFSPLTMDIEPKRENAYGLAPVARPRVASTARRTALGWSKRSTGKSSTDQKENVGQGVIMTFPWRNIAT